MCASMFIINECAGTDFHYETSMQMSVGNHIQLHQRQVPNTIL